MLAKFNEKAQKIIVIAESEAFDLGHSNVGSEHLLLAMLNIKDNKLKKLLEEYGIDNKTIHEDIVRLFGENDSQPFYMEYSEVVKGILELAIQKRKQKGGVKVTDVDLTIALLETKDSVAVELLKKHNINSLELNEIIYQLSDEIKLSTELDSINSLININQKVKKNKVNIVGRDKEIEQLCTILRKKEKSNALIIGEAGVGKSALVEKLATMINDNKFTDNLNRMFIYELNLTSVVAGTKYRGEFEEKLEKIINKVKKMKNVILFIDEIHTLVGCGGAEGAIDASNILKPYLARKDITIIGATTIDEYHEHIKDNSSLNRRFSMVSIQENTKEETLEILKNLKPQYEKYHNVVIKDGVLEYIINACDSYIKDKKFPDKALDILDLSCIKATKPVSNENVDMAIEEFTGLKTDDKLNINLLIQDLKNNQLDSFLKVFNPHKHKVILDREHEVQQVLCGLNRYEKSNVMLLGDAGVGKTAIIEELSRQLQYDNIGLLSGYMVVLLDLSAMKSNTKYVGTMEKKVEQLFNFLQNRKVIVFVDEGHSLTQSITTSDSPSFTEILKPYLARSGMKFIIATTTQEYKKHLQSNSAFDRRFKQVMVKAPTTNKSISNMINKKIEQYSKYYNMTINSTQLDEIIEIMKSVKNRQFPDKVLDVIDDTMSMCVMNNISKFDMDIAHKYMKEMGAVVKTTQSTSTSPFAN